jgi:hypothetical protein
MAKKWTQVCKVAQNSANSSNLVTLLASFLRRGVSVRFRFPRRPTAPPIADRIRAGGRRRIQGDQIGRIFAHRVILFFLDIFNHFFLKYTQWQCILSYDNRTAMYKFQKTLHPGGIQTRVLLFCRWTRWPLYHATRATLGDSVLWEAVWKFQKQHNFFLV